MLCCGVLYCIVLCCNVLCCTVLCCTALCCATNGANTLSLAGFHRLFAQDPALGLGVLRGLQEWKQGRVCLEVLLASRGYMPKEWARISEVGFMGGGDEELWGGL